MDMLLLILGLVLLVGAGDALVRGAVALSLQLGMPAVVISATVVAFGTSAPELLISVKAALADAPGIALGNVVGSNIANVLLVLGVPALIVPLAGCSADARRNTYFMLGATVLFTALMINGVIYWWGGLALFSVTAIMVWDSVREGLAARQTAGGPEIDTIAELEDVDVDPSMPTWKVAGFVGAGIVGLPIGAHLLIAGAQGLAHDFGVSEAAIGLTVVALGTSLPELATTVMAAVRRHSDVAIGNVIGSNLFNITAIIGIAAVFHPLKVPAEILYRDLWVMIGATALLVPYILFCRRLCRVTGTVFLALYAFYVYAALSS